MCDKWQFLTSGYCEKKLIQRTGPRLCQSDRCCESSDTVAGTCQPSSNLLTCSGNTVPFSISNNRPEKQLVPAFSFSEIESMTETFKKSASPTGSKKCPSNITVYTFLADFSRSSKNENGLPSMHGQLWFNFTVWDLHTGIPPVYFFSNKKVCEKHHGKKRHCDSEMRSDSWLLMMVLISSLNLPNFTVSAHKYTHPGVSLTKFVVLKFFWNWSTHISL